MEAVALTDRQWERDVKLVFSGGVESPDGMVGETTRYIYKGQTYDHECGRMGYSGGRRIWIHLLCPAPHP